MALLDSLGAFSIHVHPQRTNFGLFRLHERLSNPRVPVRLSAMSTVQEIEAALPRLSRAEIERIRAWIDDYLEDQLELTDEVKARLDQSRKEIADGNFTTRQPK
jgi:hypothetical protein